MKHYSITLSVPDDFNPDEMGLNIEYPDQLAIESEGFEDLSKILAKLEIEKLDITPSSVVVFKFPAEQADQAPLISQVLKEAVEDKLKGTVIGLVDDIELMTQNSAEAIDMLQQMINKINSKAIIKMR